MITVRLPPSLRPDGRDTVVVDEDVRSIDALIDALDRRVSGLRALFEEGGCNFAVNDQIILHRVRDHALRPGDTVEIVPAIAGG
jgi:molybdopterin converting factor small subunit